MKLNSNNYKATLKVKIKTKKPSIFLMLMNSWNKDLEMMIIKNIWMIWVKFYNKLV
jgi:hypothetical protein